MFILVRNGNECFDADIELMNPSTQLRSEAHQTAGYNYLEEDLHPEYVKGKRNCIVAPLNKVSH